QEIDLVEAVGQHRRNGLERVTGRIARAARSSRTAEFIQHRQVLAKGPAWNVGNRQRIDQSKIVYRSRCPDIKEWCELMGELCARALGAVIFFALFELGRDRKRKQRRPAERESPAGFHRALYNIAAADEALLIGGEQKGQDVRQLCGRDAAEIGKAGPAVDED